KARRTADGGARACSSCAPTSPRWAARSAAATRPAAWCSSWCCRCKAEPRAAGPCRGGMRVCATLRLIASAHCAKVWSRSTKVGDKMRFTVITKLYVMLALVLVGMLSVTAHAWGYVPDADRPAFATGVGIIVAVAMALAIYLRVSIRTGIL